GDFSGRGWRIQSFGEGPAGEGGEAPLELKGEGQVDLLPDDRPEEPVEHRGRLREAPFGAFGDETGEPEFAGKPRETGGVLVESEEANDDGMRGGGERRLVD